ncbi:hypothetical protein B7P43_G08223 [Cryptotermes secundus]|uniref:TM2 domain-containing protein n=1 Tax=Cryptotermes secundus TaxID=105785 RepID=A0A2J7RJL7_9NEOP|nr:hypothetical protein B7P43_G08223 [Cryptotermes secundus]
MADFREQRAAVKFCFLLGKSGTETLEMLKTAYKDDAMGKTQVFEWFSRFKNGEMSIDDKPRSGRPSTARTHENVEKIREIIKEDRRRTIEEIVELSGVIWSSAARFVAVETNCTVKSEVLCLGRRTFLKNVPCNWTGGYKWSTALVLSITLGGFGADRFYLGHWQEGIGKLFSFGGLGVWTLIDVILISLHYLGPADGSLYI